MLQCVTLWIGESLGAVERACLKSVLRQGHSLILYCYRPPAGVPMGIEIRDAAEILPESAVFYHSSGSVALFSDWFRYELLKRGAGTWIDTDLYLIAPLDEARPYLFGEQRPGLINNAVLRLPANSPIIDELLLPFKRKIPPWLTPGQRMKSHIRQWFTGKVDIAVMPWGTTGPAALTAATAKFGLTSHILPPSVFYPIPWERASWILDPKVALDNVVSFNTVSIHLWNECIRHIKNWPAPKGSFLARLQDEGA